MRARVDGIMDVAEWKLEHSARHVIPLIRKNNYYFYGMEDVSLDRATPEAKTAPFERKRAELQALGFAVS